MNHADEGTEDAEGETAVRAAAAELVGRQRLLGRLDERAALIDLSIELGVEQGHTEHEQHDEDADDAHHDDGGLVDRRE